MLNYMTGYILRVKGTPTPVEGSLPAARRAGFLTPDGVLLHEWFTRHFSKRLSKSLRVSRQRRRENFRRVL